MERKFSVGGQQGGYEAGVSTTPATMLGVDEAYLNGYFSELSFQSILQPLCPYVDVGVGVGSSETPPFSPATYGYFTSEPPMTYQFLNPEEEIKMPKHEALNTQDFAFQLLKLNETTPNAAVSPPELLINFFSTAVTDHLPPLRSLEPKKPDADVAAAAAADQLLLYQTGSLSDIMNVRVQKITESSPYSAPPTHQNDSVVPSPSPSSSSSPWTNANMRNRYMPYKSSALARQRRQRISEKTRCLQRLLPWDKKMDMGTMLEEAYKYIKFLQAQISILENMPVKIYPIDRGGGGVVSSSTNVGGGSGNGNNDVVWGDLGKLSRQQLLEVVVNSPVAQTVLYSRGCCVYSMEQLVLLNKNAHNINALPEQLLLASPLLFY